MKKLFSLLVLFMFIGLICFAQDSTHTTTGGSSGLSPTLIWILSGIVALYELAARLIPTLKNYSIIGVIITLIQKIIPNNSTTGTKLP